MKHFFKTLYFVLVALGFVLPAGYGSPLLGFIASLAALLLAMSIRHPTMRTEGAYLITPVSAIFWAGCVWAFQRDWQLCLLAALISASGLMALVMMGVSYMFDGPDDPLPEGRPLILDIAGGLKAEMRRSVVDVKNYKWTGRRVLQLMLWGCIVASAAAMILGFPIILGLVLSLLAIGLTFAYDASSIGRIRATYAAFASLCLVGVLSPFNLGLIPIIFLVMFTIMAVTSRED